jgi:hypothetical protein
MQARRSEATTMTTHGEEAGAAMQALADWVGEAAGRTPVALVSRAAPVEAGRIEIRLVALVPCAEPRMLDRRLDRFAADYLVCWRLADPVAEANLMSDLAFALAATGGGFEIAEGADVAAAAARLQAGPVTGLLVRCELVRDRSLPRGPRVRHPAVTRLLPMAQLEGVVLGPENVPIAGATVRIAGDLGIATTDPRGRFRFAVPEDVPLHVNVAARGAATAATLTSGAPTTITLPVET